MKNLLPDKGRLVDVLTRSSDAEFILEDDEFDFEWKETRVDPSLFMSPDEEGAQTILDRIGSEDRDQLIGIMEWINLEFAGRTDEAIRSHPLLALGDGTLLDGWHRLYLWFTDPNNTDLTGISTLVGRPRRR